MIQYLFECVHRRCYEDDKNMYTGSCVRGGVQVRGIRVSEKR